MRGRRNGVQRDGKAIGAGRSGRNLTFLILDSCNVYTHVELEPDHICIVSACWPVSRYVKSRYTRAYVHAYIRVIIYSTTTD